MVAGCSSFESGWCNPKCQRACDGAVRAADLPTLAADEDDGAPPLFTEAQVQALAAAAVALALIAFKFYLVWDVAA